jgi:hypothetical protein
VLSKRPFDSRAAALIVLAAIVVGAAALLYARMFAGRTLQYAISPDVQNVAECREYEESSATTANLITVELRGRYDPIRHTVMSGLDYGAQVSITWLDSRRLLIRCLNYFCRASSKLGRQPSLSGLGKSCPSSDQ